MENKDNTIVLLAEEVTIDEKRSNDIFLLITFKLFDNRANRNREGVTAAFISEILNHREKYAALPIYADVRKLLDRDYRNLGHNYDPNSGRFDTEQIGGLVDFTTSFDNQGIVSLYAEARIPKREADICDRLIELYENGGLNVSFEIRYNPANVIEKDGVRFVDAGDGNTLTGMAVVSIPACPDAVALDMVAETIATNEVKDVKDKEELELAEVKEEEEISEAANEEAKEPEAETEAVAETAEPEAEVANAETAEAEVVHESVNVYESVSVCPETGETMHEVHEEHTIVETVDPEPAPAPAPAAPVIAEEDPRDKEIEELKAELERVNAELTQYKEAQAAAELKAKQDEAKAFAEAQGLDCEDEAVKQAVAEVNYEAIAKLSMAKTRDVKEEAPEVTVAGFVAMELKGEYGGLLERATAK